jgi:DNA-binding NarL/FixJ family response regulator
VEGGVNISDLADDESHRAAAAGKKWRILIVDGHDLVRRGLRELLREEINWEICGEAASGREAICLIDRLRPDIVVLEYLVPEMNGLDITRYIARNHPKCQVLIHTMFDEEGLIHDVLQAGARGFVQKSDRESELVAALRSLARRRPYFSGRVSEALLSSFLLDQSPLKPELTPREREVIQMIARGNSNKTVAALLNVSVKTVESHRASAMRKTGAHSSASLTRYAIRNRLIEL